VNPNDVVPQFKPTESNGPCQVLQGRIVVLTREVPGIVAQDHMTERQGMTEDVAELFSNRCVLLAFGGNPAAVMSIQLRSTGLVDCVQDLGKNFAAVPFKPGDMRTVGEPPSGRAEKFWAKFYRIGSTKRMPHSVDGLAPVCPGFNEDGCLELLGVRSDDSMLDRLGWRHRLARKCPLSIDAFLRVAGIQPRPFQEVLDALGNPDHDHPGWARSPSPV